jgi:hypothetical protein
MSVVWKLEYNGEVRPLRQWGLVNAVIETGNQVTDTMTLTVAGEDPDEDPQFEFEKRIVLFSDNVRFFTGWVTQLPTSGDAAGDRQEYVVEGPWYWLDKIIYNQPHWVLVDPDRPDLGYSSVAVGKAVLFQSATGAKSNAGAQAQDVVDYAIFKATQYNDEVALFAREDFTDLVADAPWESSLDLSCAEALRRCTRWIRDAVAWWDYTAEIPVLHVDRRASLTPALIDLNDSPKIVEGFSVAPRPDLVPRGVILRFGRTRTVEDEDSEFNGSQWTEYVLRTAGVADGGPRCISATLTLSGSGAGAEPIPSGLAEAYFSSLSTKLWEGSITLKEAAPSGLLAVGNVLNLNGGKEDWETMAAVIQSVVIDIAGRTTEARFGPADQLGPQDFLDQVRFQRGGPAGPGSGTRFDGTPEGPDTPKPAPPSPPSPGTPPQPSGQKGHFIEICEGGINKRIFIGG